MIVAGVDDAGRGPVIGPMVVAGISIDEDKVQELVAIGVRDSKALTPEARKRLASRIRGLARRVVVRIVPPEVIDAYVGREALGKLNMLEAKVMAEVIAELEAEEVYVDASDVNEERYRRWILSWLERMGRPAPPRLIARHHADASFPVVAAASIIAKVTRDEEVEKLKRIYGDFGSGYPSDPRTIRFLKEYLEAHGELPPIVRRSWRTVQRLLREHARYGSLF